MTSSKRKPSYVRVQKGSIRPGQRENACVFSHFSKVDRVAEYVFFYLQSLKNAGCDIVFVSTADEIVSEDIDRLLDICSVVVVRKNYGYDFGSYKFGIDVLTPHLAHYKKLILANDSCYGPFHDLSEMINYGDHNHLDMWGATDSFAVRYHIQSFFIVYSSAVFMSPAFPKFWDTVRYTRDALKLKKQEIIDNYEIGGSTHFIDALFRLGAFCSVAKIKRHITHVVDKGIPDNGPMQRLLLSSITVKHNPTHFFWDVLIRDFHFPFIKRELLQVNPVRIAVSQWESLVKSVSDYDTNLVHDHLAVGHAEELNDRFDWLFEDIETPSGLRVPFFLTQLLTIWPDLNKKLGVGVDTEAEVLNSIAYWEHPLRTNSYDVQWPENNQFPKFVREPAEGIEQDAVLTITKGAVAAWNTRPDIQSMDLSTAMGRKQFMYWRLSLGQREYRFLSPTQEELDFLNAPCEAFGGKLSHLPNLALLLPVFHAGTPSFVEALHQGDVELYNEWWAIKEGELRALLDGLVSHPAPSFNHIRMGRPVGTFKSDGINVIGLPNGQFGIGEDARTATRALLRAGFETSVCPAPIAIATTISSEEWTDDFVQDEPVARTNLINLPAADTYQLLMKRWAPVLAGRYNICAWQWELPVWPEPWRPLLNIPDEIWAQSKYVQKMFQAATDKPVTYMPLAVDKPFFAPRGKAHFGIPEQAFAFLSVFDCNSWIKRKNPTGALRAFAKAFPPSRTDVRLVVKIMNSRRGVPEYEELLEQVAKDERIILIDEFLSRSDMLALIDCCDVFVSLHRSEGFGRVVAEAMYVGKPVISTNFSGSVDFAFEGTAYVVDGPLVKLQKGDYVEYKDQYWMDPDVDAAAQAMVKCIDDPEQTRKIALAGQEQIANNHTVFNIAVRYLHRLKALGIN